MEIRMRKAVLIGMTAAAVASAGCGRSHNDEDAGPVVERSYKVGDFNRVEVAGPFEVTIHTGAAPSVSAKGNQKLIERLEVEVRGDKLVVHPKERHGLFNFGWGTSGQGSLAITVPNLSAATLAGSGGITIDKVQGDRFEGQIAGSGDLRVDSVDVGALQLGIAGSGNAQAISGKAASAKYEIMGSGGLDASGITSETVKVTVAGAGEVKAHATKAADVNIMGSGDVTITGGAKCDISKAGSGDVHCS
jgi:hypothetical protein